MSVPRYALLILYGSYILPVLGYGDVIYDTISTADSCPLENVQKAAAKYRLGQWLFFFAKPPSSTCPLFQVRWL